MKIFCFGATLAFGIMVFGSEARMETAFVVGTALSSVNKADPAPQKGKYLEIVHGGVVLMGKDAGVYLQLAPRRSWRDPIYLRIEYENPMDPDHPLSNDMELPPYQRSRLVPNAPLIRLGSPTFVKGLKPDTDYLVTVRVFQNRSATTPLDVLSQKIRSHVDSTNGVIRTTWSAGWNDVYERWKFSFDDRHWYLGNQASDPNQSVREYVLEGELVTDWSELVTSQFISSDISAAGFLDSFVRSLAADCPALQMRIIEQAPEDIVFEWWHAGCGGYPAQHEVRRIARGSLGIYSLAMTMKTKKLDQEQRDRWIALVRAARFTR